MSEAPPSTSRICPVIQLASAEQSSATAFPRSAGMPCEVTAQDLQRRLGRTHGHPRLPTAEAAAGRIGHGDDPPSVAQHRNGLLHSHQESFSMRIDGKVEHIEPDGHRPFVKGGNLRPGILFTKMSRAPNSDLTRAIIRRISSGLQTSACKTKPSEPQARNFSRVALA